MSFKEMETNLTFTDISLFPHFGIFHLHNNAFRVRFTRMMKNAIDALFRQMAFNLLWGTRVVKSAQERGWIIK